MLDVSLILLVDAHSHYCLYYISVAMEESISLYKYLANLISNVPTDMMYTYITSIFIKLIITERK